MAKEEKNGAIMVFDSQMLSSINKIRKSITKKHKSKLIKALNDMGFNIEKSQLLSYLKNYAPPGSNRPGAGDYGKNTYSDKLFGGETNPTARSDDLATGGAKEESLQRSLGEDNLILERWRKLAGLL